MVVVVRVLHRRHHVHMPLPQKVRRQVVLQQVHRPPQDVATLPGPQEIRVAIAVNLARFF